MLRINKSLKNPCTLNTLVWVGYLLFFVAVFSPAWMNGFLLAPEDSFFDYAPRFCLGYAEWTDLIFAGFSLRSDPQQASFYPLRLLFCEFGSWNSYVIMAYSLAAFFTYLFVLEQTQNRCGAVLAGLVFGASGYLLRFVHMQSLTQAIIWLPLILWGIERQKRPNAKQAIIIGATALAMSCFGGHPQMFFYSVMAASLYALFVVWTEKQRRKNLLWGLGGMFVLAMALSAPQWMSTLDFLSFTNRAKLDFQNFTMGSWQFVEWCRLLVPSAFSLLNAEVWNGQTACSVAHLREEHTSTGLVALVFAAASLIVYWRKPVVWFWAFLSVFSLMLALGSTTIFGDVVYLMPGYNLFRVPSRHMILFVLAVCVLVGFFFKHLQRYPQEALRSALLGSVIVGVLYAAAVMTLNRYDCLSFSGTAFSLSTTVAMLIFFAVPAFVYGWPRFKTKGRIVSFVLLIFLCAADLLQSGWFRFGFEPAFPWPHPVAMNSNKHELLSLPRPADLMPPEHADEIKQDVLNNHTRIWASRGKMAGRAGLLNNVSMGWGLPNMGGYSPLAPKPVLDVMQMIYGGTALSEWWRPENQALNISSIEYVTTPTALEGAFAVEDFMFSPEPLAQAFGAEKPTVSYTIKTRQPIQKIGVVSILLDAGNEFMSGALKQGTVVASIEAYSGTRRVKNWDLRYGHEVAHALSHCSPSFGERTANAKPLALGTSALVGGKVCPIAQYFSNLGLSQGADIDRITLSYKAPPQSNFRVMHLSLLDDGGDAMPVVDSLQQLDRNPAYEWAASVDNVNIYRNKDAQPRAYLVDKVFGGLRYEEQLRAIHYGRLPWGAKFEANHHAVFDGDSDRKYDPSCKAAPIKWKQDKPGRVELRVVNGLPCFLVLADSFYKNWQATVNDSPVNIYQTNVAFRGIELPAGENTVAFVYVPSVANKVGNGLGIASLAVIISLILAPFYAKAKKRVFAKRQR